MPNNQPPQNPTVLKEPALSLKSNPSIGNTMSEEDFAYNFSGLVMPGHPPRNSMTDDEFHASPAFQEFIGKRIAAAERGEMSNRTVDDIFNEVMQEFDAET